METRLRHNETALLLMQELARTTRRRVIDLYDGFGWELAGDSRFSSLVDAFGHIAADESGSLLLPFNLDPAIHGALLQLLRARLASVLELPRGMAFSLSRLMGMGFQEPWQELKDALGRHGLRVDRAAAELRLRAEGAKQEAGRLPQGRRRAAVDAPLKPSLAP